MGGLGFDFVLNWFVGFVWISGLGLVLLGVDSLFVLIWIGWLGSFSWCCFWLFGLVLRC